MEWLIGVGLWGVVVLFAWGLCVNFRRADERAERLHEDRDREVR